MHQYERRPSDSKVIVKKGILNGRQDQYYWYYTSVHQLFHALTQLACWASQAHEYIEQPGFGGGVATSHIETIDEGVQPRVHPYAYVWSQPSNPHDLLFLLPASWQSWNKPVTENLQPIEAVHAGFYVWEMDGVPVAAFAGVFGGGEGDVLLPYCWGCRTQVSHGVSYLETKASRCPKAWIHGGISKVAGRIQC